MSRADLIVSLVKAGSEGDQQLLRTTVEAMAAEERAKQHHQLADRLVQNLGEGKARPRSPEVVRSYDGGHGGLLYEIEPRRTLDSLFLADAVRAACGELIEEQHRRDLLRSYSLEPRHRLLLSGAPGNGKTSLAEALAHELMTPLFVVRYEAVIGSFLGETSGRLKRLFDFVRTHQCVLFFDEFDTLGKERGDTHETGEIKRVVSSLLLQIDALPSHVVVVTATNHAELLDRAVWRRFQLRLEMSAPTEAQKEKWFVRLQEKLGTPLGMAPKTLAAKLPAVNFSDLEQFCEDIQRRYVLALPNANLKQIVSERLKQWRSRFTVDQST
ncbi:AAA family ATPase [Lysobacter enzymogenes]|uniref:AAA family ATPase n=1 Tax=Lysobacter enzymogenes TaxID=69 RepID=UPI000942D755|nr:ATP-binding protein [Lysobacter enzymogenes]